MMVELDRLDQVPHLRWHSGRMNPMTKKFLKNLIINCVQNFPLTYYKLKQIVKFHTQDKIDLELAQSSFSQSELACINSQHCSRLEKWIHQYKIFVLLTAWTLLGS